MSTSLYTGVSGLQAAQQMLDVVGNNLANLNTTGFKSQTADFADLVYQTLAQATGGAVNSVGGTDPTQVGLGTFLAGTTTNLQQGALQQTGNNLDLAIEGNGYFVVSNGNGNYYTRAGSFGVDSQGYLVDPTTGYKVQRFGTTGEATSTSPAFQSAANTNIQIPYGTGIPGTATANVTLQGNLSASTAVNGTYSTSIQIFDSQGTGHSLSLTFTKSAANTYTVTGALSDNGTVTVPTGTTITFGANGSLASPATIALTVAYPSTAGVTTPQTVTLNLGTVNGTNGLTQFGGTSSAAATAQDGLASGVLTSVTIGQDGTVNGAFSNGAILPIAQIALAQFANPGGLSADGNNYYSATVNSGAPVLAGPEAGGRGLVQAGTLEQSNVDVSTEFTNLIIAQRAFEVNAKAVTTSDEVVQDLANIIR
jgi:flagellar hook protein FlgE